MSVDEQAPDEPRRDEQSPDEPQRDESDTDVRIRRSRWRAYVRRGVAVLAVLWVSVVLVAAGGVVGGAAALLVGIARWRLPTPTGALTGVVGLAAVTGGRADSLVATPATSLVVLAGLAGLGLLVLTAPTGGIWRRDWTAAAVATGGLATTAVAVGFLQGGPWLGLAALAVVAALVGYGTHRYELVRRGVVGP